MLGIALLGIALLGATGPLLAAPRLRVAATRLDAELAAIARDGSVRGREQGTVFVTGALPGTHPDRTVSGRHSGAGAQQWCVT
jgi:hypothetical protein